MLAIILLLHVNIINIGCFYLSNFIQENKNNEQKSKIKNQKSGQLGIEPRSQRDSLVYLQLY